MWFVWNTDKTIAEEEEAEDKKLSIAETVTELKVALSYLISIFFCAPLLFTIISCRILVPLKSEKGQGTILWWQSKRRTSLKR